MTVNEYIEKLCDVLESGKTLYTLEKGTFMPIEGAGKKPQMPPVDIDIDVDIEVDGDEIPFCDMDCDACDPEFDDWDNNDLNDDPHFWGIPDIDSVVFNPPATIVFWDDGTKTVVKCAEGQEFERYAGFSAAVMKKLFGTTAVAKEIMEECDEANWKKMIEEQKREKREKQEAEEKANREKKAAAAKEIGIEDLVNAFFQALIKITEDEKHEASAE